jgi:hypothetical protein
MSLSEEQKAILTGWIQEGLSLSDIQKRLESEFEIRLTYMDVRFLVDDLDLELQSEGPQFDEPKVETAPAGGAPGTVSVSLDKVSRPDALVSGQVTFSDGMSAQWHLDQMGRLSLNPKDAEYRPSQEDLQTFQTELSEAVKKAGMF